MRVEVALRVEGLSFRDEGCASGAYRGVRHWSFGLRIGNLVQRLEGSGFGFWVSGLNPKP